MTPKSNVIIHNCPFHFNSNSSCSIKGLNRTLGIKLKQTTNARLLVKVYMVIRNTPSRPLSGQTIIICCSCFMSLNVITKES